LLAGVAPQADQLRVTLLAGDGALAVCLLDRVGLPLTGVADRGLAIGRADVGDAEAQRGERAALEPELLHVVQQVDRRGTAELRVAVGDHAALTGAGQRAVIE